MIIRAGTMVGIILLCRRIFRCQETREIILCFQIAKLMLDALAQYTAGQNSPPSKECLIASRALNEATANILTRCSNTWYAWCMCMKYVLSSMEAFIFMRALCRHQGRRVERDFDRVSCCFCFRFHFHFHFPLFVAK